MATLDELKDRVLRYLDTLNEDGEFDESKDIGLVVDGISSAFDAILPWRPKLQTETISSGTTVHELPSDLYEIEAILDSESGEIVPKLMLEPGRITLENYWVGYPTGSITFKEETSDDLTLYYLAYWDKPETEDDLTGDFDPPEYCMTPMVFYASAYVLLPESVQTADIRQYNVRSDSGNPEHNPIEESVKFLLTLFKQEMDMFPAHQRSRK